MSASRLIIDLHNNMAVYGQNVAYLTPREAEILSVLRDRVGEAVSAQIIYEKVFRDSDAQPKNVHVQILKLRRKIARMPVEIMTHRRLGYQLRTR